MARPKHAAPGPLQQLILATLRARGLTPYWLAQQCGWAPSAVYRKLRTATSSATLEHMLAALGMQVISSGPDVRLELRLALSDGRPTGRIQRRYLPADTAV